MKKYVSYTIIFLITLTFFIVVSKNFILKSEDNPPLVTLEIKSEYTAYLLGQAIWINCKILNNSDDVYYYKLFNVFGVNFIIKDENGKRVYGRGAVDWVRIDSMKILPKQEIEKDMNIERYPLGKGRYTIMAEYQGLTSNTLELSINQPTGIEAEVYNKMNYAESSNGDKEELLRKDSVEESLVNTYPQSAYAPVFFIAIY